MLGDPPAKPDPELLDRNDEAGVQARVNQAELDAWKDLYAALAVKDGADKGSVISFRKAYREAVGTRLDSAKKLAELQARSGTLVSADVSRRVIEAALTPVVKLLRNLPSAKAAACNPTNPGAAREVLEAWVGEAMKVVKNAVRK